MAKLSMKEKKKKRLALIRDLKQKKKMANKPVLPSRFTAKATGNEIELSWNESKANFDYIKVDSSPDGDNWDHPLNPIFFEVRSNKSGRIKFVHRPVAFNTKYYYRLQVKKGGAWSEHLETQQQTGPDPEEKQKNLEL